MSSQKSIHSRRSFLTQTIPACALFCFARPALTVFANEEEQDKNPGHKFDALYDQKLRDRFSYRMFYQLQYGQMITLCKNLESVVGKKKLIETIKEATEKRSTSRGQRQANEHGDEAGFKKYTDQFRDGYQNKLRYSIVKDTKSVMELKVTECIWHEVFKRFNAEEYGHAQICHGDYAWASGYHPKLRMERDKTLMEGDSCCNHCYIWG